MKARVPEQITHNRANTVDEALRDMKSGIRPFKRRRTLQRLKQLSEESLSLEEVNAVINNEQIWRDFWNIDAHLKKGQNVSHKEMVMAHIILHQLAEARCCHIRRPKCYDKRG